MKNRNFEAELICMDAYKLLRNEAERALTLLNTGHTEEGKHVLELGLLRSKISFETNADIYLSTLR